MHPFKELVVLQTPTLSLLAGKMVQAMVVPLSLPTL
jgi:hypothetical protein